MAKRRLPREYWRRAFGATFKNLRIVAIIIAAAAGGLWILVTFSGWREHADDAVRSGYHLGESLRDAARTPAASEALWRLWRLPERERRFDNRDALTAAFLSQLPESQGFPDITKVTASRRLRINSLEQSIADLNVSDDALRGLLRRRDFEMDAMRLDLVSLPERQRQFVTAAVDDLDAAVARVAQVQLTSRPKLQFASTIGQAAKKDDPLHILFESMWYLAIVLVVLAISYCAATILKLLPYPGAADKWSNKIEENFAREPAPESTKSSSAASLLLTATVLGIGVASTGHILREQPGSPFYGATLGDLLPASRNEAPLRGSSDSVSSHTTVNVAPASASMALLLNQTFSTSTPITIPAPTTQVYLPIQVKPGAITGLEQLSDGVMKIGSQAQVTNNAVASMREMLANESAKTDSLQRLVGDAATAWNEVAAKVETTGTEIRSGITTAEYNAAGRSLMALRHDNVAGTWHWWRHALFLSRYVVNETTLAVFSTEPCQTPDLHRKLHETLDAMGSPLSEEPPRYAAPFESTIIARMIGIDAMKNQKVFVPAREEVRRHLAVILEASRVAE